MGAARKKNTEDFAAVMRLDAYAGGELGPRTRLIQEALDQVLTPMVRDQVMARAGWDDTSDAPADRRLDYKAWVDTKLFPRLVDKTTLTSADELRRSVRQLLERTDPPPAPEEPEAAAGRSGLRLRRPTPPPQTVIPRPSGSTILLWTRNSDTFQKLQRAFGTRAELVLVSDALEMLSTMQVLDGRVSLVVVDDREDLDQGLRLLTPEDLRGHQIVVWGPESLTTPTWGRLLGEADRAVGCTGEASLGDVADLCTAILGVG